MNTSRPRQHSRQRTCESQKMWAMAKNLVIPDSKVIRRFDVENIEHFKDS